MEEQLVKIQRSVNLIKGFMVLVVLMEMINVYQTEVFDLGKLAGSFAVLSFLRAVILSPNLLVTSAKYWFKSSGVFSTKSVKYFLLAIALAVVNAF